MTTRGTLHITRAELLDWLRGSTRVLYPHPKCDRMLNMPTLNRGDVVAECENGHQWLLVEKDEQEVDHV